VKTALPTARTLGLVGAAHEPWITLYRSESTYFVTSAVQRTGTSAFLDEAGIGRAWSAHLREGVAELAPITGIEPSDPAPQRVWSR
jgi:hypothetical protein